MKLTAKTIELAQPANKEYLLSDGEKLYLRVHPSGGKSWQFNYTSIEGKRVKLTLGAYPEISLASARELAAEQRRHLAMGKDPRVRKLEEQQEARRHALATFEKVAREWHAHAKKGSTPLTGDAHSSDPVDHTVPSALSHDSHAVILKVPEPVRSA